MKFDWKVGVIVALLLLIVYLNMNKRQSGFSETRTKLQTDKCPDGFRELGPTICVKD